MQRIGVISDTHLKEHYPQQLPLAVCKAFENVDMILHAGDINALWVLEELALLAPVRAVLGNTDDSHALPGIPLSQRIAVEGCVLGLTHGHIPREPRIKPILAASGNTATAANALSHFQFEDDVSCVIFGHSHFPLALEHPFQGRKVLLLNPGSATQKRTAPHRTCAVLYVDGTTIKSDHIVLDE